MESSLTRRLRELEASESLTALPNGRFSVIDNTPTEGPQQQILDKDGVPLGHIPHMTSHWRTQKRWAHCKEKDAKPYHSSLEQDDRLGSAVSLPDSEKRKKKSPAGDRAKYDDPAARQDLVTRQDLTNQGLIVEADADSSSDSEPSNHEGRPATKVFTLSRADVQEVDQIIHDQRERFESDPRTPILTPHVHKLRPGADGNEIASIVVAETKLEFSSVREWLQDRIMLEAMEEMRQMATIEGSSDVHYTISRDRSWCSADEM